ncbi:hypothetical protein [Bacillus suaedaesalsae]|uniref:Uncharacterized protein n=1 Tax=Bacillus suaedaesalsae TaxID=2810349 RepID=A0ABS2DHE1_9BACI|nr:hypothetical protein [Bacillus suaedaesalsae]MBM6617901.1 hypothetical protein [Bacillus suaedaesalsae]
MYFTFVLLISFILPVLFRKAKNPHLKWIPSLLFVFITIILGFKVVYFPSPEMAILADIMYVMTFGIAIIGSIIGAIIVKLTR